MDSGQTPSATGVLEFVDGIRSQHGLVSAILVVLIAGLVYAFKQMLWQVWKDAIRVRDREITRLARERDVYQKLVFQRLRASEANSISQQSQPSAGAGAVNRNTSTDGEI